MSLSTFVPFYRKAKLRISERFQYAREGMAVVFFRGILSKKVFLNPANHTQVQEMIVVEND